MSGTLADRPAFAEALVLRREGKARALVVYPLDRLPRDLVLQEQTAGRGLRDGRRRVVNGGR